MTRSRYADATEMDFEMPLTSVVWITSVVCILSTFLTSVLLISGLSAGDTFKATAKPVLTGTAVVGAPTMIFSMMINLTDRLTADVDKLSLLHTPFLLGLLLGGAVIHCFTGASIQTVITGAYRAVEYIGQHIHLNGSSRAGNRDSSKVAICT